MKIIRKHAYYTLKEILEGKSLEAEMYSQATLKEFITEMSINLTRYPIDLDNANVKKIWDLVYSRMIDHPIIKLDFGVKEDIPNIPKDREIREWIGRFLIVLASTYDYYDTLLTEYTTAKSHLMDDIKATSKNKTGFNDTPQNDNGTGIYEGDDYLTNFTKSDGESSTEMSPKIIRLKEIQENYKNLLYEWSLKFERVFYEEVI